MSKHRIAALIAGGTLILGSGVAFAGEMDLLPQDPSLAPVEEPAPDSTLTDEAPAPADTNVAPEVEEEAVVPAAEDETTDVAEDEAGEDADGEHGSVVSEAAHNHDFDEACGNHGAYVSEVAKGGDAENPTCDDEPVAGAETSSTHGKSSAKERPAKASGGKAKHGK